MILNLSDVLSEQHKAIHESVPIEMTCFKSEMGDYAITEKTPLELSVEYAGDRKLEVTGKAEITSVASCDRCLEDVEVKVTLDFKHKIDTFVYCVYSVGNRAVKIEYQSFDFFHFLPPYVLVSN